MESDIKCPYCGSHKVEKTVLGYAEQGGGFVASVIVSYGVSLLASALTGGVIKHTRAGKAMQESIPCQYECLKCHRTFHV